MKFTNAIIYRAEGLAAAILGQIEDALHTQAFIPCAPSQEKSAGFVSPREENGPLVESVAGQWIARFQLESKSVPGSAVRRKVDERCAEIERVTGRKPGKKEKRDLKEDIVHELLPMAFTKIAAVNIWIDPAKGLLVIDTASASRADEVVTALVRAIDGLSVTQINTVQEPAIAMSGWLGSQEAPAGFTVDREVELKATDESKSVVRYAKHALDIDEVRQHIADGKRPTRLALTWEDRVSFVLSETGVLRKIAFIDGFQEDNSVAKADVFDSDVAIVTGELSELLVDLFDALGGEAKFEAGIPKDES